MIPPSIAAWLAARSRNIILIAFIVIVGGGLLTLRQCQRDRVTATQQRVDDGLVGAARDSAADTINSVAAASERDAASERTHKDNADAIRQLPGAAAPVDPVVAGAARRGLCRYAAYRERAECVHQPAARPVATPR